MQDLLYEVVDVDLLVQTQAFHFDVLVSESEQNVVNHVGDFPTGRLHSSLSRQPAIYTINNMVLEVVRGLKYLFWNWIHLSHRQI